MNPPVSIAMGLLQSRQLDNEAPCRPPSAANEDGNPASCNRAPPEPPARPLRAGDSFDKTYDLWREADPNAANHASAFEIPYIP